MADIFNRLMASKYPDAIRRLFGEDLEVSTMTPELGLDILVDSMLEPENRLLHRQTLLVGSTNNAATPAALSHIGFRNPTGSGLVAIIERVRVVPPAATGVIDVAGQAQSVFGNPSGMAARDVRVPGAFTGATPLRLLQGSNAVLQGTGMYVATSVGGGADVEVVPEPIVVFPGFEILIAWRTVNIGLQGSFWVRSRPFRPEELALT